MIDIINTSTEKRWEIRIPIADLFKMVSLQTSYILNRFPIKSDFKILTEDDRAVFDDYLRLALGDLNIMLARYYQREFDEYEITSEFIFLNLSLSLNCKDSISYSLNEYIKKFIEYSILKNWYGIESYALGIDAQLAETEYKIKSSTNYRRVPVRRPINPIF
jgi:hypothetical protein